MRIGAQESVAGGLHLAFERGVADGAEAVQVFTKSSRQWACKELSPEAVAAFRAAQAATGIAVICHDSYLINLGSEPGEVRSRSLQAFQDELGRCAQLGISWLVAHPGAHENEERGLQLIAEGIRTSLDMTQSGTGVLLEITAGQGVALGYRFEHLRRLLDLIDRPERTGVCLDTCHLYAAGYDIATDEGYARTMAELEATVGSARVRAIHINDSKKGLGCRVDRHENIGQGTLGVETFARFVRDARFAHTVGVLETPEGRWKEEIALLKSLRDGRPVRKEIRKVRKSSRQLKARQPNARQLQARKTRSARELTPAKREAGRVAALRRPARSAAAGSRAPGSAAR
jgi:deoxyribonuclease-4